MRSHHRALITSYLQQNQIVVSDRYINTVKLSPVIAIFNVRSASHCKLSLCNYTGMNLKALFLFQESI